MLAGFRSRSALLAGFLAFGSIGMVPEPLECQVAPAARIAARAINWGKEVLVAYGVTKGLDLVLGLDDGTLEKLLGEGREIEEELDALGGRLSIEASVSSANRTILLRQAVLIEELRQAVSRLSQNAPPSTEEIDRFGRQFGLAVEEIQRIQVDYGRRIGNLEEGLDSLGRLLESRAGTPAPRGVLGQGSPLSADTPTRVEPVVRRFRAGPLALELELMGFNQESMDATIVLSLTVEGTSRDGDAVVCRRAALIDDLTGEWEVTQSSGLVHTNLRPYYASSAGDRAYPPAAHTTFLPGAPQTKILRFVRAGSSQGLPSEVILDMDCLFQSGRWDKPFSITSPAIPVKLR